MEKKAGKQRIKKYTNHLDIRVPANLVEKARTKLSPQTLSEAIRLFLEGIIK